MFKRLALAAAAACLFAVVAAFALSFVPVPQIPLLAALVIAIAMLVRVRWMLAVVALLLAAAMPAFADATTVVTVPIGNWVTDALGVLQPTLLMLLTVVVAWAVAKLPAGIAALVGPLLSEQILKRATDFALNAVAGAAKDKAVSVDVGNQVVQAALTYVVQHAPEWAAKFDTATLIQKIIARLDLAANAKVTPSGSITAAPTASPSPGG